MQLEGQLARIVLVLKIVVSSFLRVVLGYLRLR